MTQHSRMTTWRWLARALILCALPLVLVVGTGAPGNAALAYGPVAKLAGVPVIDRGLVPGGDVVCSLTARWITDVAEGPGNPGQVAFIDGTVACKHGFDVQEYGLSMWFNGAPGCGLGTPVFEMFPDGVGSANDVTTREYTTTSRPADAPCAIYEVCFSSYVDYYSEGGGGNDTFCEGLALGEHVMPEAPTSCPLAEGMSAPEVSDPIADSAWGSYYWSVDVEARVAPHTAGPQGWEWIAYAVVGDNSNVFGGQNSSDNAARLPPYIYFSTQPVTGNASSATVWRMQTTTTGRGTGSDIGPQEVIGVGLIGVRPNAGNFAALPQDGGAGSYATGWEAFNGTPAGLIGVNRHGACQFYWGEKIAHIDGTEDDDPLPWDPDDPDPGPGDPEDPCDPESVGYDPEVCEVPDPGPGDDTCDFSWTDPSTWATGGICALVSLMQRAVRLLGSILATLGGLVAGIVNGIVNGLEALLDALFVPDPGFLESELDGAGDDFMDGDIGAYVDLAESLDGSGSATAASSPFSYSVPGVASLTGGSGCTGPTITWEKYFQQVIQPLNACTGIMAQIAPKFRLLVMLGLGIAGFFAGLSMLTTAFGIEKKAPYRAPSAGEFYGKA